MVNVEVRKVVHVVEDIFHEGGPRARGPTAVERPVLAVILESIRR